MGWIRALHTDFERANRDVELFRFVSPAAVGQEYLIHTAAYLSDHMNSWGPVLQLDWKRPEAVHVPMGGANHVIPPNIYRGRTISYGSTPPLFIPAHAAQR